MKLKTNIDTTKITGLTDLLIAADALTAPGANVPEYIEKIRAALNLIGEKFTDGQLVDAISFDSGAIIGSPIVVRNLDGTPATFYHLDGKPATPDIDEDLGQLLLAVDKGFEFIHNGPGVQVTDEMIQELYHNRVTQVIPKLKVVIENRISVLYPYSKLVDMSFMERNDLTGDQGKFTQLDKLRCSIERMSDETCSTEAAEHVMTYLATIMEHIQQVMNLFGWTIDDVKLASRQKIAGLLAK